MIGKILLFQSRIRSEIIANSNMTKKRKIGSIYLEMSQILGNHQFGMHAEVLACTFAYLF